MCSCLCKFFLLIFAMICPPLAVACHMGCNNDACINFVCTLFFYIPGVVHAWYIILSKEPLDSYSPATVVHVHQGGAPLYNL